MGSKVLEGKNNEVYDALHPLKGCLDRKDPIYDSESEGSAYFLTFSNFGSQRQELHRTDSTYVKAEATMDDCCSSLSCADFLNLVDSRFLPDAMESEESGSVCEEMKGYGAFMDLFVSHAVRLSLDKSEQKQKWMSELLTLLYDCKVITRAAATRGFEKLVQRADNDLKLDVPHIHERLTFFLTCAVEDKVLDESYLRRLPESFLRSLLKFKQDRKGASSDNNKTPNQGGSLEDEIKELQSLADALQKYKRSAEEFISSVLLVSGSLEDLKEFLEKQENQSFDSRPPSPQIGDRNAAADDVDSRPPPTYYKHEVVRAMLRAAMGRTNVERELVSSLLSDAFGTSKDQLSPDDIWLGFVRVLGEIEDLKIDIPDAESLLIKFFTRAIADEILPPIVVTDCARLAIGGQVGRQIAKEVKNLICGGEGSVVVPFSKFRRVWLHPGNDCISPENLKEEVRNIAEEFFKPTASNAKFARTKLEALDCSSDEVLPCVREILDVGLSKSLEEGRVLEDLVNLLRELVEGGVIDEKYVSAACAAIDIDMKEKGAGAEMANRLNQFKQVATKQGLLLSSASS